jgi:hypothetical protein
MVPVGMVPSPCFDNTPCVTAIIDLMPEVDRGSVVKAGLKWSFALRPCTMLVARLVSRLLYFLFLIATRGWVTLVALAAIVPPVPGASSEGATDQRSFAIVLRPQGQIPSGRQWMLPVELHECAMGQVLHPLCGSCWASRANSMMAPIGVRYSRSATTAKALLRFLLYIGS